MTVRLPVEPEIRMLPPVLEAKAADCPVCDIEREAPVPALHDSAEASNTAPLSEAPVEPSAVTCPATICKSLHLRRITLKFNPEEAI